MVTAHVLFIRSCGRRYTANIEELALCIALNTPPCETWWQHHAAVIQKWSSEDADVCYKHNARRLERAKFKGNKWFLQDSLYVIIYECLCNTSVMFPLYVANILGQNVCLNVINWISSGRMKSVFETPLPRLQSPSETFSCRVWMSERWFTGFNHPHRRCFSPQRPREPTSPHPDHGSSRTCPHWAVHNFHCQIGQKRQRNSLSELQEHVPVVT